MTAINLKCRTKINAVARALLEGYTVDYESMRFALMSAYAAVQAAEEWDGRETDLPRACVVHESLWPDEMTTCLFDQVHGDGPPECREDNGSEREVE